MNKLIKYDPTNTRTDIQALANAVLNLLEQAEVEVKRQ